MCGRYALSSPADVRERYGVDGEATVTYNAAPSQSLPVVGEADPEAFTSMEWGLVPPWADDDSDAFVNARGETLREKRSFRDAYERRRCVVPADGFYEWHDGTPYYFERADGRPFVMAGVWEPYTPETTQTGLGEFASNGGSGPDRTAETRRTFAVVTAEATGVVADYHHRASVVLDPDEATRWLTADDPADLLDPSLPDLSVRRVSTAVDDPTVDRPDLVDPV